MQLPEQIKNIYDQIGGNHAMAMAFAQWSYNTDDTSAIFTIAKALRRGVRDRITHVRVQLLPSDTYRVEFLRVSMSQPAGRLVSDVEPVFAQELRGLVQERTGLRLSMGTMGQAVAS